MVIVAAPEPNIKPSSRLRRAGTLSPHLVVRHRFGGNVTPRRNKLDFAARPTSTAGSRGRDVEAHHLVRVVQRHTSCQANNRLTLRNVRSMPPCSYLLQGTPCRAEVLLARDG